MQESGVTHLGSKLNAVSKALFASPFRFIEASATPSRHHPACTENMYPNDLQHESAHHLLLGLTDWVVLVWQEGRNCA